jgi:ribosome-binding protein aMBF1 (putative translation factor)
MCVSVLQTVDSLSGPNDCYACGWQGQRVPEQPTPDLGSIIAANVRAERARRRWKQSDLGDLLGWSAQTVSHLESGRRGVFASDLYPLCKAFGISLAKLLDGAADEELRVLGL